jgi:hypothetical protein
MAKTPKKKTGRPYSLAYTAAGTPRRYLLSGIPAQLWITVRAQAKRENIAMRQLILTLLEGWLFSRDPKTQVANALAAARAAITPEQKRQLAERAERTAKRQARTN